VDSFPAMLKKASSAGFKTQLADIATWSPPEPVDVIFSNAALQWLSDHTVLFPRLLTCLASEGILAIQMPAMHNEPVRTLQSIVASSESWSLQLSGVMSAPPILEPAAYYDIFSELVSAIEIWIMQYLHVLRGKDPVLQWTMGTSLRPYLDALRPSDRPEFMAAYSKALRPHYPPRADGTVLLPFRRLFIIAKKCRNRVFNGYPQHIGVPLICNKELVTRAVSETGPDPRSENRWRFGNSFDCDTRRPCV